KRYIGHVKRISLAALCLAGFLSNGNVSAQVAGQKHSLSMDVVVVATGGHASTKKNFDESHGTATSETAYTATTSTEARTYERSIELAVTVRNLAAVEDRCEVEWLFIAQPVKGKKDYVFDKGVQTVAIKPGGQE